jgi:hypothetical protein
MFQSVGPDEPGAGMCPSSPGLVDSDAEQSRRLTTRRAYLIPSTSPFSTMRRTDLFIFLYRTANHYVL